MENSSLNNNFNHRKIAGIFKQFKILSWKNGKLLQRNKLGTFSECLMALLFVLMLLLIRYIIDLNVIEEQSALNNYVFNVFDLIIVKNNATIYYYPNNSFVQQIVTNAYYLIKSRSLNFTATSIIYPFLILII